MRKNLSREGGTKSVYMDLFWCKLEDKSPRKGLQHVCFPVKFPKIVGQYFYWTPPDSCSYMLISQKKYLFVCYNKETASRFFLALSVPEKLKIWIFEMLIITQTLNINNLRTASAKSINLHNIRKLVEYSLKNVVAKAMFNLTAFEIPLSEGRFVSPPA